MKKLIAKKKKVDLVKKGGFTLTIEKGIWAAIIIVVVLVFRTPLTTLGTNIVGWISTAVSNVFTGL